MTTIEQVIGSNVRQLRETCGWSQAQLGERIGEYTGNAWPPQTVSLMEKGERAFVAAELLALADMFNKNVGELFWPSAPNQVIELASRRATAHGSAAPVRVIEAPRLMALSRGTGLVTPDEVTHGLMEAIDVSNKAAIATMEVLKSMIQANGMVSYYLHTNPQLEAGITRDDPKGQSDA